jgi:predicted nucleic acid-binding protein
MKLYLETTIPNFLFADDAPDKQRVTRIFFEWMEVTDDELFISQEVENEISRAPEEKRVLLRDALRRLPVTVLPITPQAEELAQAYLNKGVLPPRFLSDALHVAIAVCHHLDVVVTWNMKHLANMRRVTAINRVNISHGLPAISVHTPEEVMYP